MHVEVAVLPHHVAVVIELEQDAGRATDALEPLRRLRRRAVHEQVAIREPLQMLDALRVMPLMHGSAVRVEQIRVPAPSGAVERVAAERLGLVAIHETERSISNPRHSPTLTDHV